MDIVLENALFKAVSEVSRLMPSTASGVSKLAANTIGTGTEIAESHKVYATARLVRFMEMEYGVPAEMGPEVLLEIHEWIQQHKPKVHFPLEYRYVKGDDIPLSPAYGRDTCFISVHQYKGMPHQSYFRGLEEIFLRHNGRPHWGKMHTQTHEYLAGHFPLLAGFKQLRQATDPHNVFLTDYARSIIGPDPAPVTAADARETIPAF
jgi:FAD/FMN-containing dehydrogenase